MGGQKLTKRSCGAPCRSIGVLQLKTRRWKLGLKRGDGRQLVHDILIATGIRLLNSLPGATQPQIRSSNLESALRLWECRRRLVPDEFLDGRPESIRRSEGRKMKSLRWMLITAGALVIGSFVVSLVPDLYRYLKIRAM